ncbi:MAG TPA: SRPBCC domain-containing protein [Fimbriimonadaceae bacterium]|nr:SRPBCC domain-containing protein [Fimbriimonadaceae bacterium]
MSKSLRKEVVLPYPPEKVWVALTDRAALAEWLMPNDFEPVVGRKFRLQVDGMGSYSGLNECEVLEVDEPRKLVYNWVLVPGKAGAPRPKPMVLTWTLEPSGSGTKLTLVQEGLEALGFFNRLSMAFGWGTMLNRWIPQVLTQVEGGHFVPGPKRLVKRCYGIKTIPDDLTR